MASEAFEVSVIIPVGLAAGTLDRAIESVIRHSGSAATEVVVVNDARDGKIRAAAGRYPVKVCEGNGGGAAAARNVGVRESSGRLLVFLDADCVVLPGWLEGHLEAHTRHGGLIAVGGAVRSEPGGSLWARCDGYCSWYNVHPRRPPGWVPNQPAANLSVARSTFLAVGPFREDLPRRGVHEELEWQGRLLRMGGRIRFEPGAVVGHSDRNDFSGFLKHNYVWGYNSIAVKGAAPVSRFPFVYRARWLLIAGFLPFAAAHTCYTVACWLRAGILEPLALAPLILLGRIAYAAGMAVGGVCGARSERAAVARQDGCGVSVQ